jgi:hypothetical protein
MRNTRNQKKKGIKARGRRTRKGGYWLYPSETDNESNFSKLLGFGKKATPVVTEPTVSTPSEMPPPPPPVEVKAVETEEAVEVPATAEPAPVEETVEETAVEEEQEEQAGGKKRRKRRKGGNYSEQDFKKMYGNVKSSAPAKKRGSAEAQQALKGFLGGEACDQPPCVTGGRRRRKKGGDYSQEDFKKMYGNVKSSAPAKKRGSAEAQQALQGFLGGNIPEVSGGRRRTKRKKSSKKKRSHKKTKKTKKTKKRRKH